MGKDSGRSATRAARHGLSLVELLVVIAIVGLLLGLVLCGVQAARQASVRLACGNNLRQIGLALHMHHGTRRAFPPGVARPQSPPGGGSPDGPDTDPYPVLPWLGRILPYLEQEELFRKIEAAYLVDSYLLNDPPHVSRAVVLPVFFCPADGRRFPHNVPLVSASGPTSYLGVSGTDRVADDGVLFVDSRIRIVDITDGTSSTVMVGERPPGHDGRTGRWHGGYGFWYATDSTLGVRESGASGMMPICRDGPYHFVPDRVQNPCAIFHFWSVHPRGGHFLFADGGVRFLTYDADAILPQLATRAGDETVVLD